MTLLLCVINAVLFSIEFTVIFVLLTLMGYATGLSAQTASTTVDWAMVSASILLLIAIAVLYLKKVMRVVGEDVTLIFVTVVLIVAKVRWRFVQYQYRTHKLRPRDRVERGFQYLFVLIFLGGIGFLCLAVGIVEFKVEFVSPDWFGPVLVTGLMLFASSMLWFFLRRHDRSADPSM